jgi:ABC-2 type transport system permease protein
MAAAVIGMFVLFVLYLMDSLAANIPVEFIQKAILSASFYTRYLEFTRGVFDLSSVVYFISIAVLFNFFSVRVLDKRRWG